uniref:Apple domain-containing protein n=1 Tax=Clytia hemisphaerica TaxID=252671 RepID=A0A7M5TYV2_9CNID
MKGGTLILLLWTNISLSHILRLPECNNYDAKFSKISYHQRLIGNILKTLDFISLRKCLTKCMWHLRCQSVNFKRQNETCELLGNSLQSNLTGNVLSVPQTGWIHFETDYDEKTLGRWCSHGNNNPCNVITERCEDRCVGNHQCVKHGESLQLYIKDIQGSSTHSSGNFPSNAFDGNDNSFFLSGNTPFRPHWFKATFKGRVFIYFVEVVNRSAKQERGNNVDLKTVLYTGQAQTKETWFGNTGVLGTRKTFTCLKEADEILLVQEVNPSGDGFMNIGEVKMFGRTT